MTIKIDCSFPCYTQSYSAAAKVSSEENIDAFRRALISNGDDTDNAREKLKSATLPGLRSRGKSAGPSRNDTMMHSQDEFPDDNTDEVINTLAKSATVPDSRTRVRKRNRATNRKSGECYQKRIRKSGQSQNFQLRNFQISFCEILKTNNIK